MINLLPPELKTGYRYARRNVGLRKWIAAFLVALVGLGALTTYGLLTIQQSTVRYTDQIVTTEANFKKEQFSGTQERVKDMSNDFKLVVKVLGQEILFSKLIQQIATTIPTNAYLTGLTISQGQSAVNITADATDYTSATQVQVNLASPANKIFSKADIVSIVCNNTTDPQYPCIVTIRALFAADNPFLFINSEGATP
jgi:Tfp pilus assembly protein PilN